MATDNLILFGVSFVIRPLLLGKVTSLSQAPNILLSPSPPHPPPARTQQLRSFPAMPSFLLH